MRLEHLTDEELEIIARGEESESDVRQHLGTCEPCRESAREGVFATRYVRPLAAGHPDEHVLTAVWSNALSPARTREVEQHLAMCTRCDRLLARLVRATPVEVSPARINPLRVDNLKAWAAASTLPHQATLVVGTLGPQNHLQASFVSIAESLRLVTGRSRPNAPVLYDCEQAFRFKPFLEGAAVCLAIAYVEPSPLTKQSVVRVTLVSAGAPAQRADVRYAVEAIFELSRGTSRLLIELPHRWEIEIRFDA